MHVKDFGPLLAPFAMIAGLAACLSGCNSDSVGDAARAMVAPISAEPPAVPLSQAKFAFAPVTGGPATVLTKISAALGREAYTQQVTLVPVDDPGATYIVKGYLSAVGDASQTTVVYVWDVFDRGGRRVHRISGQQQAAGSQPDPWASVDTAAATDIARQTIAAVVAWGKSGTGSAAMPATPAPVAASPASAVPSSAMPVTMTAPASETTVAPDSAPSPAAPILPPLPASAPGSG